MNKFASIIIDTISIQDYIFSSNKLKDNIGASYLVKKIYEVELKESLEKVFNKKNIDIKAWENEPNKITILKSSEAFEIGYIGGGNALILFKEKNKAKEFIREFTRLLLKRVPSFKTAFGLVEDFNLDKFQVSLENLYKNLKKNKNKYFPNIVLQKYGFTADCPRSNESAEFFKDEKSNFISTVVKTKLEHSRAAKKELINLLKDLLGNKYTITNDIEKFGQSKGKLNYIAIVHIDGNNMGERFKNCKDLNEIRKLSKNVREITERAFISMIKALIEKIQDGSISKDTGFELEEENKKILLPIRLIIIGGDDITFVCNGRLGLWLAEIFIREFIGQKLSNNEDPLSACGGIAIVKTKYPFFKAYKMAEYLLKKAKDKSRIQKNNSFIDFLVSSWGWKGEWIENEYYKALEGDLHFGPYRIDGNENQNENHIANLKKLIKGLKKIPVNKVMQLRDVLYEDRESAKMFLNELNRREYKLPKIEGRSYHKDVWIDLKTPYFDAIELMEFYPEGLL